MAKSFDVDCDVEELIRRAAMLPRVRVQLRGRVLRAVRQAQRRAWLYRGSLWAAVLVLSAGLGVWNSCSGKGDCATLAARQPVADHPPPQETPESSQPAIHAGLGQWDHVDAELNRRGRDRQTVVDFLTGPR